MKIATWNVNSIRKRVEQVITWLEENDIDCLCIQETKVEDEDFPEMDFVLAGYDIYYHGQKSYNGVAIACKRSLTNVQGGWGILYEDKAARIIAGDLTYKGQIIHLVNVYVPNGSAVGSDKYAYKMIWLAKLAQYVQNVQSSSATSTQTSIVMLGDFNIAPADIDIYDAQKWGDAIHASADERTALSNIQALGLVDVFREKNPQSKEFSWWDLRQNKFASNQGLRIDLILASSSLLADINNCFIDIKPRQPQAEASVSDHAPIVVTLN